MEQESAEEKILKLIQETQSVIPEMFLENLEINSVSKQPEWYPFEHQIWKNGEEIRQLLLKDKKLRNKENLFDQLFEIATNRNAKRGRQSFVMLLGSVQHSKYSSKLIKQIDDDNVNGHIIDTIYKMKVDGFTEQIKPFTSHKITWIRNIAKKYIHKYEVKTNEKQHTEL